MTDTQNQGQGTAKAEPPKTVSPQEREAAQKEVADARQKLQDAEAKLAATGATRETSADEDLKAQRTVAQSQDVIVVGKPGGPFNITGAGFGSQGRQAEPWPGQLLIAGRAVPITSWRDTSIKGTLPPDLPEKGDVQLTIGDRTLKGTWPAPVQANRNAPTATIVTDDGKVVTGKLLSGMGGATTGTQPAGASGNPLPGGQGTHTGGGPDLNPPPGSTGTMAGQQLGAAPSTATGTVAPAGTTAPKK